MGRPIDRLGIGHIILSDSTPLLWMGDMFDQVLEMDPGVFDGFVSPFYESEDHISKGRGVGGLVSVLLEEDASSSKRFLPAIARDSFCRRR
ncbi:hypothetical protein Tco_1408552 [Tanacetum coccineum]